MSDLSESKKSQDDRSIEEIVDEIIDESPDLFAALAADDVTLIRHDDNEDDDATALTTSKRSNVQEDMAKHLAKDHESTLKERVHMFMKENHDLVEALAQDDRSLIRE